MELPECSLPVLHVFEPSLEFGSGQTAAHPKDGLFLYGPHNKSKKTKEIRIGVVGTLDGIGYFRSWAVQIKKRVEVPPPGKTEKKDRLHLANFPGVEEAFGISFNENELVACVVDKKTIDATSRIANHHEAVSKVVQMYVSRVRKHNENEEHAIDVWVLVVPEIIFERCRPESKRAGLPMGKRRFRQEAEAAIRPPALG